MKVDECKAHTIGAAADGATRGLGDGGQGDGHLGAWRQACAKHGVTHTDSGGGGWGQAGRGGGGGVEGSEGRRRETLCYDG